MLGNMRSLSLDELMNMVRTLRGMQHGGDPMRRPEWSQRPIGAPWGNVGYGNINRENRPGFAGGSDNTQTPYGQPSWTPNVMQGGFGQTGSPPWAQNKSVTPPVTPTKPPRTSAFGRGHTQERSEYL